MESQQKQVEKICVRCDNPFYVEKGCEWKKRCYRCYKIEALPHGFNQFKHVPYSKSEDTSMEFDFIDD